MTIDEALAAELRDALRPREDEELTRLLKQVAMLRWLLGNTDILYGPPGRHLERN